MAKQRNLQEGKSLLTLSSWKKPRCDASTPRCCCPFSSSRCHRARRRACSQWYSTFSITRWSGHKRCKSSSWRLAVDRYATLSSCKSFLKTPQCTRITQSAGWHWVGSCEKVVLAGPASSCLAALLSTAKRLTVLEQGLLRLMKQSLTVYKRDKER